MKKKLLIVLLLALIPVKMVFAVEITQLYVAEVPVTSQLHEERAAAVKKAFLQMLVRLTGDPAIAKNPEIKPTLNKAEYYVQEYSYSAPTTSSATFWLRIHFEKNDVNRLLRRAGIAYWGEKRPSILVWLTEKKLMQIPEIVGNEAGGSLSTSIRNEGRRLALPLIFPIMDVADMSLVSPDDIITFKLPTLIQAGQRYAPNAYLIGTVVEKDELFDSNWELVLGNHHWTWVIADKSIEAIVKVLLPEVSQTLAKYIKQKGLREYAAGSS